MVTYQEVIGGDHSNNGEINSRAVALSKGSIYCKSLRWTFGNSVVLTLTLAFERCIKLFHLLEEII